MGARLGMEGHSQSYGIYVASGLLAWTCFANTLQGCAHVFRNKRNIIGKVNVDLRIFPLAVCLGELIPFFAGLALMCLADLFFAWSPSPGLFILLFLAFWCQQALAVGLGAFFGCCAVFARDVLEIVAIGLQIGFWFTPIVYLPSILPDWLCPFIWINPMTCVTEIFQQCFVFGNYPPWKHTLYLLLISHMALCLGIFALHKWQKDIRDVL